MHHDLLHTHTLLGAIVLAQVVLSSHHTEGHFAGAREEQEALSDPGGALFPQRKLGEAISHLIFRTRTHRNWPRQRADEKAWEDEEVTSPLVLEFTNLWR